VQAAELPWRARHVAWFGTGLPADILHPDLPSANLLPAGPAAEADHVVPLAMRWDYATYLRDHLLVKGDRATMLASLEARAPYLDRELTRFAFALPDSLTVRGFSGKWLLRRVARRWLPRALARRTKRGMSVPVSRLMNGPLALEVDRLLSPGHLARQGLLNPAVAGELVSGHRRGGFGAARGLWTLLLWQLWLEHWIPEGRE
jgi:asparagine synthase (glutamine-hydrolysing)